MEIGHYGSYQSSKLWFSEPFNFVWINVYSLRVLTWATWREKSHYKAAYKLLENRVISIVQSLNSSPDGLWGAFCDGITRKHCYTMVLYLS